MLDLQELWKSKAYVSAMLRDVALRDARKAYLLSRADALRTHITEQELCSFTWQFKCVHVHSWFTTLCMVLLVICFMTSCADQPLSWVWTHTQTSILT